MAIALRAAGTATSATAAVTAVNPAVPTGVTAADICVLTVYCKPYSTTLTTPTGWTKLREHTNGTVAHGTDTGSTKVAKYIRLGGSSGAIGNIVQSGANTMGAVINVYSNGTGNWDYSTFVPGGDSTNGANYSATGTAFNVRTGDWVEQGTAVNGDVGTPSSFALAGMSGATRGTYVNRQSAAVTTGTDCRGIVGDVPITAGSSTAAPTFTYTNASSGSGTTIWLRLRELPAITAPVVSITDVETPWHLDAMTEDSPSIAVEDGDRLLVCYTKADRESQTNVTFSTLSGSTEAWTHHHVHVAASDVILAVASTVATATGNVVVRKVNTSGTATINAGWYVMVVRGMGAVGNVASGAGQSVSLAVSEGSLVVMINSDWDAVSGLGTFVPSTGALEIASFYLNGAYDLHSAYWVGEAAGTRSYGTTGGSGTDFRVCAIEILAAGATTHSAQGTLAATAGLTGTAAKVTGTGGSLATTVGLSGTAEVVKSVGGALATTASLTGSAEVVKSVTGALATTVALSGAATVGVPPVTVAGELATTVALTGAAEVVTTPPVEVTGELATTVGLEGSAGLAVAATGEMATVVGLSGTAEIAAEPPPAVYRGLRDISAIYHGETPVTRVYHGEERL